MTERVFRFKQFSVQHAQAAMKVGTDGVLLGAWSTAVSPTRILDIGTGCGLVALMLAQRYPEAQIDAVEIDRAASDEAAMNFSASPWSNRLHVIHGDVTTFEPSDRYSLIVTNPPWYDSEMKSPERARTIARHSDSLPAPALIDCIETMLAPNGSFCLVLPVSKSIGLTNAAVDRMLTLARQTSLRPTPEKPVHRVLMQFQRNAVLCEAVCDELTIETGIRHDYTPDFRFLLKEFFLRF